MAPNSKLNAKRKEKRDASKPKPSKRNEEKRTEEIIQAPAIPLELQQLLLNIFRNSFADRLSDDINPLLQEIKGHLYNRDFATAFGKTEYLEAYAARWSPSRALGYMDVFWNLKEHLFPAELGLDDGQGEGRKSWKVVCLGGGAGAEVVAMGGLQKLLKGAAPGEATAHQKSIDVVAIDIANWTSVVDQIAKHITTAPPLSKYASAAAKAANTNLLNEEDINIRFLQRDVFEVSPTDISTDLATADLVTLMFTLNELYSASISSTQKFLLALTEIVKPGALLLVVDSPGSYSSVTLNGTEKKYPMHWLLDHTLLKQTMTLKERGQEDIIRWEKVQEDESRWFRLPDTLSYPIELENMRMQLHLYRRV
ncbi:hypothetical protein IQ07DRAFT_146864 [Pyrenochaeta sp. DS3sAY3a]|nr:hypothetical protein IQ07DRAFT_146864 [Pyrenochaeta sp. DS3sAY3a]